MRKEHHSSIGLFTIGITALFLAGFFLLVVFGAQSYRNTVAGQNGNMQSRALLSYLSTTVKGYDAADAVLLTEDPEVGQVLGGFITKTACCWKIMPQRMPCCIRKKQSRSVQRSSLKLKSCQVTC